jgi:hypothetical protein
MRAENVLPVRAPSNGNRMTWFKFALYLLPVVRSGLLATTQTPALKT